MDTARDGESPRPAAETGEAIQRSEKCGTSASDDMPEFQHIGDVEAAPVLIPLHDLHRGLRARHISMIAIGGAIGTGLIIGTGATLAKGGPGSLFISFVLVGIPIYVMMTAVGEFTSYMPDGTGFAGYGGRFVDPAFGFTLGWNYFFKYLLSAPSQLTAAALVLEEWVPRHKVNPGVWIAIFLVVILALNYIGVAVFGEVEFWLSMVKVLTFIGLIILCLVLVLGGGPNHDRTGFRYWRNPGAFASYPGTQGDSGRFIAFASILVNTAFAYIGTELVGVTAGEAKNPSRDIPRAVRLTFWRILIFYCASVFLLGLLVPYNSKELAFANNATTGAAASPFVVAIQLAGISVLPTMLNAIILLFVLSTANSDLYIVSRTIYALGMTGQAPKIFQRTNQRGVPIYGLMAAGLGGCVGFLNVSSDSRTVFLYLVNVATIFGMLAWISLLTIHIRFVHARRAQGVADEDLAYTAPFGLTGSYASLAFFILVCFFKNFTVFIHSKSYGDFDYKTFITGYIGLPFYVSLYFGYKVIKKTKIVKPAEVDLVTGRRELIKDGPQPTVQHHQPVTGTKQKRFFSSIYSRGLSWIF